MLTGEKDEIEQKGMKILPDGSQVYAPGGHSDIIKAGLPPTTPIEHRVIRNAGQNPHPKARPAITARGCVSSPMRSSEGAILTPSAPRLC